MTFAGFGREKRLISKVHKRLVGIVMQEFFDVLRQPHAIVESLGIAHLIVIEFQQKLKGEILYFPALFSSDRTSSARWNLYPI